MDEHDSVRVMAPAFLDSYFVVDRDRKIQEFNPAFGQMLQLRPSQRRKVTGSPCYDSLRLEICKKNCIALECFQQQAPVRMNEIQGRTADGQPLVLELAAIPIKNAQGQVSSVFVTHRDVTGERRLKQRYLEEQKQHTRERAELLNIIEDRDAEIEEMRRRQGSVGTGRRKT